MHASEIEDETDQRKTRTAQNLWKSSLSFQYSSVSSGIRAQTSKGKHT